MEEELTLDGCIQDAIAEVVHGRDRICTAATKYYTKSLALEIDSVIKSKCVLPKKNSAKTVSKYDLKKTQENLFPLTSSDDDTLKLSAIQKKVDELNREKENIKKISNILHQSLGDINTAT